MAKESDIQEQINSLTFKFSKEEELRLAELEKKLAQLRGPVTNIAKVDSFDGTERIDLCSGIPLFLNPIISKQTNDKP